MIFFNCLATVKFYNNADLQVEKFVVYAPLQ